MSENIDACFEELASMFLDEWLFSEDNPDCFNNTVKVKMLLKDLSTNKPMWSTYEKSKVQRVQ